MRRVRRGKKKSQSHDAAPEIALPIDDGSAQLAMVRALIPLGLRAVEEALVAEVDALAGRRYEHQDGGSQVVRWGKQQGSVFIADQKLPITVPRVRDLNENRELALKSYEQFQTPRSNDLGLYRRVVAGISCRDYEAAAEAVPEAFGVAKSSVSRRFVRASARSLRSLMERRHDDQEWLVLVLDGKSFAQDQLVIALGVTTEGDKRILGVVQTATENKKAVAQFLRDLEERGFASKGERLLVIVDGSKGLIAAARDVFGERIEIQRCQWHKRENVVSYLSKGEQPAMRRKLQAAYEHPSYADAKRALDKLHRELKLRNESAANSLAEGLEETLTLHRLDVFPELGTSFKTTNLIENVMGRVDQRTRRVGRWTTSDQKLRWCASALLDVEKRFRRVRAHKKLHLLKAALQVNIKTKTLKAG
jgi:putative transposase